MSPLDGLPDNPHATHWDKGVEIPVCKKVKGQIEKKVAVKKVVWEPTAPTVVHGPLPEKLPEFPGIDVPLPAPEETIVYSGGGNPPEGLVDSNWFALPCPACGQKHSLEMRERAEFLEELQRKHLYVHECDLGFQTICDGDNFIEATEAAWQAGAASQGEGWISVKDRLPDEDDWSSLLFVGRNFVYYGAYSHEHGTWYEHLHGKDYTRDNVTLWQPLPAPPKGSSDKGEV